MKCEFGLGWDFKCNTHRDDKIEYLFEDKIVFVDTPLAGNETPLGDY